MLGLENGASQQTGWTNSSGPRRDGSSRHKAPAQHCRWGNDLNFPASPQGTDYATLLLQV